MISKADWQAVHDRMTADERGRLGAPPTAEEVAAYMNGTLAPEEEARIRALLVAYPELARTLTTPFPADDAQPGDADYLSEAQINEQWERFRSRRTGTGGRVLRFWQASAAIAATLALLFGGLLWKAQTELADPRVGSWNGQILTPGVMRGPADGPVVGREGEAFVLALAITTDAAYPLEIVDAKKKVVWRSETVKPAADDTLAVHVPADAVQAGQYTVVYGPQEYYIRIATR